MTGPALTSEQFAAVLDEWALSGRDKDLARLKHAGLDGSAFQAALAELDRECLAGRERGRLETIAAIRDAGGRCDAAFGLPCRVLGISAPQGRA